MYSDAQLIEILLVEDNQGDVDLTLDAFKDCKFNNNISVAYTGDQALDFLYKRNGNQEAPTPDIILLDLNLPGTNGKEVLEDIKSHDELKKIPVVMLTSSNADRDIIESYEHNANCYIVKPVEVNKFIEVIKSIENFWISVVKLPPKAP